MAKKSILVVDDEEDILELIKYNLTREGYSVVCASSGEEGLELARTAQPDLVVLDLMLPGLDGLDICKMLKSDTKTRHISVIMLTAKGNDSDVVIGLELGADDYVVKPFSPRVLLARIKTALRRESAVPSGTSTIKIDKVVINPERFEVSVDGAGMDVTSTEFKILHLFAQYPGVVFTRSQIVDRVHGVDYPVTDRSVDVQIVALRRKLGDFGDLIETVRGVGYRFRDSVE